MKKLADLIIHVDTVCATFGRLPLWCHIVFWGVVALPEMMLAAIYRLMLAKNEVTHVLSDNVTSLPPQLVERFIPVFEASLNADSYYLVLLGLILVFGAVGSVLMTIACIHLASRLWTGSSIKAGARGTQRPNDV